MDRTICLLIFSSLYVQILEINPRHPFVVKLLEGCPDDSEEEAKVDADVENAAWLLFDMASLNGGFPLADTLGHSKRLSTYLESSLSISSLELEDEIDPPEEEVDAEEIDMDGFDGINMEDFDMDGIDLD